MKLVVNLLLGIGMQAIAEAVSLGEHLQLNRTVSAGCLVEDHSGPSGTGGKAVEDQDE